MLRVTFMRIVRTTATTLAVTAALGISLLGVPAYAEKPTGEPIKIGSLASMTGLTSTFGTSSDAGIRLAAEERNAAGGVLGRPIEIITADTESDPNKTPLAVLKLLTQDQVVAVIGEVASTRSLAAAPACQKAHIPMLTPASTNIKVTRIGNYIFRSCFTDDFQGVLIAKFSANDLKFTRAALLTDTKSDYSTGLTKVLESTFPKLGGTIVARETYQAGDSTFKTQLTNIKAANPQIVFLPGYYTEIAQIVTQARELGITCPFIGGDGWDSEFTLKNGGKAVEGCYFTNHYFAPALDPNKLDEALQLAKTDPKLAKFDPKVIGFVARFMQRYQNNVPDAMAVLGYDGANIMFDAIERAKSTEGEALRDSLAQTKDYPAVTGNITLGKDRNAIKPGVVIKIQAGAFEMVKQVEP